MLLKLNEPNLLIEPITIISELVEEVRVKVNDEGLSIVAYDPANVALTLLKIPKAIFSEFDVGEELIGLNLGDLKQILQRIPLNSILVIAKRKKENVIHLNIQEKDKDKTNRSFTLALISIEDKPQKARELQFTSHIELPSEVFAEAIKDAVIVGEECYFTTTPETFVIDCKGTLNRSRTEFAKEDLKLETVNAKAKYSLVYLQKFIKASKIAKDIGINFSNDYPLRLDFNGKTQLSFIIAPLVEEE